MNNKEEKTLLSGSEVLLKSLTSHKPSIVDVVSLNITKKSEFYKVYDVMF